MNKTISSRESLIPGNVVRLKEPYIADYSAMHRPLKQLGIEKPWQWKGFTHGIIAEVIGSNTKGEERVSLYLYHPPLQLIYLNPDDGMPVHVDFHITELEVVHIARLPLNRQPD